jgi:lipoic acid synthetase
VERFVPPSEFELLREEALALGYLYVAAGPLVRSSYRAAEFFMEAMLHRGTASGLEEGA